MDGKLDHLRDEIFIARKRARTHFAVMAGVTAALGLAIVGAGWFLEEKAKGAHTQYF